MRGASKGRGRCIVDDKPQVSTFVLDETTSGADGDDVYMGNTREGEIATVAVCKERFEPQERFDGRQVESTNDGDRRDEVPLLPVVKSSLRDGGARRDNVAPRLHNGVRGLLLG